MYKLLIFDVPLLTSMFMILHRKTLFIQKKKNYFTKLHLLKNDVTLCNWIEKRDDVYNESL